MNALLLKKCVTFCIPRHRFVLNLQPHSADVSPVPDPPQYLGGKETSLLNLCHRYQLTVQIVWLSSDMSNPLSISQFKELRNNYLQEKKKQDEKKKAARVRYVTIGWTDGQLSSKRNTQNLPYPLISKQRSRGAWFGNFRGMTPSGT